MNMQMFAYNELNWIVYKSEKVVESTLQDGLLLRRSISTQQFEKYTIVAQ